LGDFFFLSRNPMTSTLAAQRKTSTVNSVATSFTKRAFDFAPVNSLEFFLAPLWVCVGLVLEFGIVRRDCVNEAQAGAGQLVRHADHITAAVRSHGRAPRFFSPARNIFLTRKKGPSDGRPLGLANVSPKCITKTPRARECAFLLRKIGARSRIRTADPSRVKRGAAIKSTFLSASHSSLKSTFS